MISGLGENMLQSLEDDLKMISGLGVNMLQSLEDLMWVCLELEFEVSF